MDYIKAVETPPLRYLRVANISWALFLVLVKLRISTLGLKVRMHQMGKELINFKTDTVEWGESDQFWKSNVNIEKKYCEYWDSDKAKMGAVFSFFSILIAGINYWETKKFYLQNVTSPIHPTDGANRTGRRNSYISYAIMAVCKEYLSIGGNAI